MRGTVSDNDGLQHRVSRIWAADDAGVKHEVVKAWVGDASGNPKVWFDRNVVLELIVTPTVLDANRIKLDYRLGPQGELADEYQIYRNGTLVTITTLTSFIDTGLSPGTTYSYRVDAIYRDSFVVSGTASATTDTFIPPAVVTLNATVASYTQINLTWTVSGQDSFTVKRGGTILATSGTSFNDTGLTAGTAYTYTITAKKAGATDATASKTATTTAFPAFSASASATAWNNIKVSWSNLGAGWTYTLTGNGSALLTGSTSTSYNHGVGASSTVNYSVSAIWGGATRKTATASATTPARPTSTGSAYSNLEWESFTGWTGSTQRYLTGPNIGVPVGGTFTNMTLLVYGHGQAFRGEPKINGVAGPQQVYNVGRTHTDWPFNLGFGAGTFTTGITVGGTNWGAAEWSPWKGQVWNYYVHTHRLDYWYYTALERDEELRLQPFWVDELAERELHVETWSDPDGTITKARIADRITGNVIVDWEA